MYLIIGSPKPVFPNDDHKLRFYAMKYCPYAHRIQLVLDFKDIPYHTIHINLTLKPEWLTDVSPLGKVPALEIPKVGNLFESLIIADYLDEKYPEKALYSKDLFKKASEKYLLECVRNSVTAYYAILMSGNSDKVSEFEKSLEVFEIELKKNGKTFLAGDKLSMVDYMIWPWFERFCWLNFELDGEKFPNLVSMYTE